MTKNPGPAYRFDDGVLDIADGMDRLRLRWKPEPVAERLMGRRLIPCWPEIRLLRPETEPETGDPELDRQKSEAFSAFRDELPRDIAGVVEGFGSYQWPMLLLLHEQPRAMDMALSNPVLCYCLANNDQFRNTDIAAAAFQAVSHSHGRQRDILKWLGFPGTEAMARLLRRIPKQSASPSILRCLRNTCLRSPGTVKTLSHVNPVNEAVLELVVFARIRDLLTPKLLSEVSTRTCEPGEMAPADIILSGMAAYEEMGTPPGVRAFSSIAKILRFQEKADADYRDWLERVEEQRRLEREARERRRERMLEARERQRDQRRMDNQRLNSRPFPPPPVPGAEDIEPLTSRAALSEEGASQLNCVGSFASWVLRGDCYVYRVLKPERATLAIVCRPDGCWRRSQLKAKSNRAVSSETIRAVDAWLARSRLPW